MKNVVVDIEVFKTQDRVLPPKELSAFDGVYIALNVFKSPSPFNPVDPKRPGLKPMLIDHCISWTEGHVL